MTEQRSESASSGHLYVIMARVYLSKHAWGLARMSMELGLDKGSLSEPNNARELLQQIRLRLTGD